MRDERWILTDTATRLRWGRKPLSWPKSFTADQHTWEQRGFTTNQRGAVLCANYEATTTNMLMAVYNNYHSYSCN